MHGVLSVRTLLHIRSFVPLTLNAKSTGFSTFDNCRRARSPVAVDQQPIRYCRIDLQCVAYVAPKKKKRRYIKIVITTILMSLSGKHIMKITIYSNTFSLRNTAVPSKLRGTGYASRCYDVITILSSSGVANFSLLSNQKYPKNL